MPIKTTFNAERFRKLVALFDDNNENEAESALRMALREFRKDNLRFCDFYISADEAKGVKADCETLKAKLQEAFRQAAASSAETENLQAVIDELQGQIDNLHRAAAQSSASATPPPPSGNSGYRVPAFDDNGEAPGPVPDEVDGFDFVPNYDGTATINHGNTGGGASVVGGSLPFPFALGWSVTLTLAFLCGVVWLATGGPPMMPDVMSRGLWVSFVGFVIIGCILLPKAVKWADRYTETGAGLSEAMTVPRALLSMFGLLFVVLNFAYLYFWIAQNRIDLVGHIVTGCIGGVGIVWFLRDLARMDWRETAVRFILIVLGLFGLEVLSLGKYDHSNGQHIYIPLSAFGVFSVLGAGWCALVSVLPVGRVVDLMAENAIMRRVFWCVLALAVFVSVLFVVAVSNGTLAGLYTLVRGQ